MPEPSNVNEMSHMSDCSPAIARNSWPVAASQIVQPLTFELAVIRCWPSGLNAMVVTPLASAFHERSSRPLARPRGLFFWFDQP